MTKHLYAAHAAGTVKGGVDAVLGPKTLIVGPKGAGKSRIVNTLELALSGYASDVVGRPQMRSGSDLIALAPEDAPLEARVTLSDDRSASFKIERKPGGKTSKPDPAPIAGLKVIYPAIDVVAALRGTVQNARTFVLRHAGLDVSLAALKKKIPEKLHGDFDLLAGDNEDPIEMLLAVRDGAAKGVKDAENKADAAQETVDSATETPVPDEAALEAGRAAVRAAVAAYEAARALPEPVDLTALYAQAQAALAALAAQEEQVANLARVAGMQTAGSDDAAQARGALTTLLRLTARHTPEVGEATCILCGETTTVDPTDYQARADSLTTAGEQEATIMEAKRLLPAQQARLTQVQAHAEAVVGRYREAYSAHEASNGAGTGQDRATQVATAYAGMFAAEQALSKIQNAAGRSEAVEKARATVSEQRARKSRLEDLGVVCSDTVDDLVKSGREGFVARVQKYLPEGDVFDLVLREHKRDVCMFGLVRNGFLHTALSGAEWATLTLALGSACIPPGDDVLAILIPEERAYDGVALAALMRALSSAPGQVILTSPIKPRGRTPAGWTIVEAGEANDGD